MSIILICLAIFIIASFFVPGFTPRIEGRYKVPGKSSVAELCKVTLGGAEQWILIRSENVDHPILLYVHGGPGYSQLTINRKGTQPLEKYFTVVNWDQRGAGKSYTAIRDKSKMNIGQFVADILELTEYLSKRFNHPGIVLVGHSWGSVIGPLAVYERPELYSAYIGIGQLSNMLESEIISYKWTLQQAKQANDISEIKQLTGIGCPPYPGKMSKKFIAQRRILEKYGGEYYNSRIGATGVVIRHLIFSTEYTLMDKVNFLRGLLDSIDILLPEQMTVDLFQQVPELKVPVWFMLGRHDWEVPSVLSARYFDALIAPKKALFWFENSAHMPNTEERDAFNQILIKQVLPELRGKTK